MARSLPSSEFRQTITKWAINEILIVCDKCNDKNNKVIIWVSTLGGVSERFSEDVTFEGTFEHWEVTSQIKIQGKNFLEEQTLNAKAQRQADLYCIS